MNYRKIILFLVSIFIANLLAAPSNFTVLKLPTGHIPTIDGNVSEWPETYFIDSLRSDDNVYARDSQDPWTRDEFQMKLYCAWDDQMVYFAVKVIADDVIISTGSSSWNMDNIKVNPGGQPMAFYIGINGTIPMSPSSPYVPGTSLKMAVIANGNGAYPTYEFAIQKDLLDPFMMNMYQISVGTEDNDNTSGTDQTFMAVGAEYRGNKQDWNGNPWDNPLYYPTYMLNSANGPALLPTKPVPPLNRPPSITSQPDTVAFEDSLYRYRIVATDPDKDPLTISLAASPPGMFVKGDTVMWQPGDNQSGVYNVTVRVTDSNGVYVNQSYSIHTHGFPDDPVFYYFRPSGDSILLRGDSIVFSARAYDPDNIGNSIQYYWFVNNEYAGKDSALNTDTVFTLHTNTVSADICTVRALVLDGKEQSSRFWNIAVMDAFVPPEIITPVKLGVVNSDSTISWAMPPGLPIDTSTLWYNLEFSLSSAFNPVLKRINSLKGSSYKIRHLVESGELPERSIIFVRVMAFNNKGYVSGFSDNSRSFLFLQYIGIERANREVPEKYKLCQNRPNPFNPATYIRFGVPESVNRMTFGIFDVKGRLVRTMHRDNLNAGYYTLSWDGRDSRGELCRNGMYICRMQCRKYIKTIKMTMVK
jgi:hypothetical protein